MLVGIAVLGMAAGPGSAATPRVPHIVQVANREANARIVRAEQRRGTPILHVYKNVLVGFAARLSPSDIARLRRTPAVRRVWRDTRLVPTQVLERRTTATGLWGLDRIDQRDPPPDGRIVTDSNGAGVDAYVVDSGIRRGQEQFSGRLLGGFTAIDDGRGTEDCNGHGTRVAGVVGGSETGVAPAVWLIPVRVMDCAGAGDSASLIAGLDWVVVDHKAGAPAVANISLVGPFSPLINDAVDAVVADGVTVVVAAGNSPVDACRMSPSSAPSAIAVAAMTQQDTAATFSAWGSCVRIYAPGDNVLTTATAPSGRKAASQLTYASGTSISSAFVSGGAALALALNRGLSPGQVAQALTSTATLGVLGDVPAGTPNRLLYVDSSAAAQQAPLPAVTYPRVFSHLQARFTPRSSRAKRIGRFRVSGGTTLAGVLTVTRAGRMVSRRYVAPGAFAFRTRTARRISVLRIQLVPDDPARTAPSALIRVRGD